MKFFIVGVILGLPSRSELNLIKRVESIDINAIETCNYDEIMNECKDLFKDIGKICKPYHTEISENTVPKIEPV